MGEILKAPENMLHPRDYVAPSTDNKQTQGATNVVIKLSKEQIFNNQGYGPGPVGGPARFGGPDNEKASQSNAEAGTKVSDKYSTDLVSGQNSMWDCGRPYRE